MALTPELIKANEALASLSEDQVTAIATLSANDEADVINAKIGEHHGLIEKDVKEISGVEKQDGEKSYDYLKRVLGDFKQKSGGATELQAQITEKENKIKKLEKQIADGNTDGALKQKLQDTEGQLAALQTKYDEDKSAWEKEKGDFTEKITDIQVKSAFNKATAKIKFKAGFSESVQKTLISSAESAILNKFTPDWVDAGDGNRTMIFRGKDGEIARNKANGLNPYTAEELIAEHLKDAIDPGRSKTGSGSSGNDNRGGVDAVETVDIASAKTQIEADELIVRHLLQKGEVRGTASFAEMQKKIRTENGIDKLPLR